MKVAGFTIIKNAVANDFPILEAIRSILPVVDEMIVLIGDSTDETIALIESIGDPKIKIHHSVWNKDLRKGGVVLADETNKAFQLIDASFDWAFYIQGDEVVHEKYHPTIRAACEKYKEDKEVLDMFQISGMRFGMELEHIHADIRYIDENDELELDGEKFKIYHVPGHSPGSVVYHHEKQNFIISGDVLFEGSIGRTDLFKGNYEQLIEGIKTKLFILDPETKVFSGHGNPTSIGFEKAYNPFFR